MAGGRRQRWAWGVAEVEVLQNGGQVLDQLRERGGARALKAGTVSGQESAHGVVMSHIQALLGIRGDAFAMEDGQGQPKSVGRWCQGTDGRSGRPRGHSIGWWQRRRCGCSG